MPKSSEGNPVARKSTDPIKTESTNEAREVIRRALTEGILTFDASTKRVSLTETGVRHLKAKYGRVFGTPVMAAVDAINESLKMVPPIFRVAASSPASDFDALLEGLDISGDQKP